MIAVYPGSFDPVTNGHLDIITRAAAFSDRLIVGLLVNPFKRSLFTPDERLAHLRLVTAGFSHVEVKFFSGFLHDFALENGASVIIRGIRSGLISEYEQQMVLGRAQIVPELETLFMFARAEYLYLSSTLVKEVLTGGGDIDAMVPPVIISDIRRKMNATHTTE